MIDEFDFLGTQKETEKPRDRETDRPRNRQTEKPNPNENLNFVRPIL